MVGYIPTITWFTCLQTVTRPSSALFRRSAIPKVCCADTRHSTEFRVKVRVRVRFRVILTALRLVGIVHFRNSGSESYNHSVAMLTGSQNYPESTHDLMIISLTFYCFASNVGSELCMVGVP